jgi:hypothetical protein
MCRRFNQKLFVAQLQSRTEFRGVGTKNREINLQLFCCSAKAVEQRNTSSNTGKQDIQILIPK